MSCANSLQQQTATSEVLQVISSSPGDLMPIFQSLLENATRICGAKFGVLWLREGDLFRAVAAHGGPTAYREMLFRAAIRPGPDTGLGMLLKTKRFVQIDDITKGKAYLDRDPLRVATVELAGGRTLAEVPLLKDGELIGSINIYHQEVKPFTEKQIELLTSFATQAVIAIENTRLLNELRQRTDDLTESLEQQTATSEVLEVISRSPGELNAVFERLIDNAIRICGARFGNLFLYRDGAFTAVAMRNAPAEFVRARTEGPSRPGPDTALGRVERTKQIVQLADLKEEPQYKAGDPFAVSGVELGGIRTLMSVPMLKNAELIGAINIYRQEVRPFTEKQVELLQNFAAQAVIAIENTRLLNELRQRTDDLAESLEQQTATTDVLQVISASPGELGPVFETMLAKATELCDAHFGTLWLREGNAFRTAALHGDLPDTWFKLWRTGTLYRPGPDVTISRAVASRQPVQTPDLRENPAYLQNEALPVSAVEVAGIRTLVVVPMLKENEVIGAFAIYRKEVRPFTDKQIELVQNFAAQAVIAIENARLLNELRQRTDDLANPCNSRPRPPTCSR